MKKFRKLLVGAVVALAVIIPLGIVAMTPRSTEHPTAIVRIAADSTNTPRPPGAPCPGYGC